MASPLLLSSWSSSADACSSPEPDALTAVAAVAMTSTLLVTQPLAVSICAVLTGLGFSGIFPAVIALGGRAHPHYVAGATSVMIAGAGIGNILIPWAMSVVADAAGLVAGMALYAGLCGVMVVQALMLRRVLLRS